MVHCRDWCIFILTTWFTGKPHFSFHSLHLFCSHRPLFWQETKQIRGEQTETAAWWSLCNVLSHCAATHFSTGTSCCSPDTHQCILFLTSLFISSPLIFPWQAVFSSLICSFLQGCESRKHLANRARSGQTGRLRLCFYSCPSQLLRGDTLLVKRPVF